MWRESVWNYIQNESYKLYEWSKTGEKPWTTIPTLLWFLATVVYSYKIISSIFRRFIFRRTPVWEQILQQLIFIWLVIYSLHFWTLLVRVIGTVVDYYYSMEGGVETVTSNSELVKQTSIWIFALIPLAVYIQTRPRNEPPPLMIWITTSPWQRREMGPYGYYLNRPLMAELTHDNAASVGRETLAQRRAFSDSKLAEKVTYRKRRHSKSC